jgi:hypothetical protein
MADKMAKKVQLGERIKEGFVRGFTDGGAVIKKETKTDFQGLFVYRFDMTFCQSGKEIPSVVLFFVGNGFAYQIQVIGTAGVPDEKTVRAALERVTLTRAEEHEAVPASRTGERDTRAGSPSGKRGTASAPLSPNPALKWSVLMARIAGICAIAILAIAAYKLIRKKAKG